MKTKLTLMLVLLIAVACATQHNSMMPNGSASLVGRVMTVDRRAPGVNVSIIDEQLRSRMTITDAHGMFRFENIPAGHYTMKLELGGWPPQTLPVNIPENGKQVVDAQMQPAVAAAVVASN